MSTLAYWLKGEAQKNFGEYLSEVLMQELFYYFRSHDAEIRLIGSSIHDSFVPGSYRPDLTPATQTAVFWGCGVRDAKGLSPEGLKRADIRAVRGPISANALRLGNDVPLGDPGLLVPALYTPKKRSEFIGKSICIPHFHDARHDAEIVAASGADVVLRPNVALGIGHLLKFVDALCSAEFVLSASLHGAVLSAAYHREFSYWRGKTIDLPLKWDDFSKSVGIETRFVDTLDQGRRAYADLIAPRIVIPSTLPLLAAAPFPLKACALIKVLRHELQRADPAERVAMIDDFSVRLGWYQGDLDRLVAQSVALLAEGRARHEADDPSDLLFDKILGFGISTLGLSSKDEPPASREERLASIIAQAQQDRLGIQARAAELETSRRAAREALDKAKERETALRADFANADEQNRLRFEAEVVRHAAEREALAGKWLASLEEHTALQRALVASNVENERLAQVVATLNAAKQSLEAERNATAGELSAARERAAAELSARDDKMRTEEGRWRSQLDAAEERYARSAAALTAAEVDLERARTEHAEQARAASDHAARTAEILRQDASQLRAERDALIERALHAEADLAAAEADLGRARAERIEQARAASDLADRLAELDRVRLELLQANVVLTEQLHMMQVDIRAQQASTESLRHDASQLRAERDASIDQTLRAEGERDTARSERDAASAETLALRRSTNRLIDDERRRVRALVSELRAAKGQLRISLDRQQDLSWERASARQDISGKRRSWLDRVLDRGPSVSSTPREAAEARSVALIQNSGLFDAAWYGGQSGLPVDDLRAMVRHYVTTGDKDGLSPHPLFDSRFYRRECGALADYAEPTLYHYLTRGYLEGLQPHPLFDPDFYLDQTPSTDVTERAPLIDYLERGWREGLKPHPFFDPRSYLVRNDDVREAGLEPLSHYVAFGWRELRQPHPLIDIAFYLGRNPDLIALDAEPLAHYLELGRHEGRRLTPLIDPVFYAAANPEVGADEDAVIHYLIDGCRLGLQPNALFEPFCYHAAGPDVAGVDLLSHYIISGWREGATPGRLFDPSFYLSSNPDVAARGAEPLTHYLAHGWRERRSPHPVIDIGWYLDRNPDVVASETEPLTHYLLDGWREGRSISPLFDPAYYRGQRGADLPASTDAFLDYLETGWKVGCRPHPLFQSVFYRAEYMDADDTQNPLVHFATIGAARQYSADPLFDPVFYLANSPDVRAAGDNAFVHYVITGAAEGRAPNPAFHALGYMFDHRDVRDFGNNALIHYRLRGQEAGYSPHPLFDPAFYLEHSPDLRDTKFDPFEHFIRFGMAERRQASEVLIRFRYPNEAAIRFPNVQDPEVTVIIPVYRSFADTFRCLYSISETFADGISVQIVLADDCPQHPVAPFFDDIPNLRIINNSVNHGFLRNCNNAAAETGGEFIIFLNNDTVVRQGWLTSMVDLARQNPRNALIGCKLLNTDGSIQEAGGIMFTDGWGYPYGRGDDADKPEYNFVREVDCVIGACFLVRRSVFEELGGFDDRYYPAFFEEFDLAIAVANAGYKVLYQPASEVLHLGSASYGAEVRDRQSLINQAQFKAKWADTLAKRYSGPQDLFLARDRHFRSGTILIVDDLVPEFDKHAGALTMYQYMKLMVELDFKVIYHPHYRIAGQPYTSIYQQLGIEILYGDVDMTDWMTASGKYLDWVWVARPDIAPHYIEHVRALTSARLLYYTHDLHFLREQRRHEVDGDEGALSESVRLKPIEREIFRTVDCVMTPSAEEVKVIAEMAPDANVRVLTPYFYSGRGRSPAVVVAAKPLRDRREIIFVGGYRHVPNVDAAIFLVRAIMPKVWAAVPDAKVLLVGSHPPKEVLDLGGDRVDVVGFVEDLDPWYDRARMSVSPLRYGAGVKGKIVGSLEAGVPVVTTDVGNEGVGLRHGIEAMIGANESMIAKHVIRLFRDNALLESLAAAGTAVIRDRFSEESARTGLLAALDLSICNVCGSRLRAPEQYPSSGNWREEPACLACWSLNRMAALADEILRPYRRFKISSISDALPFLHGLRIHEFGFVGPIHDLLETLPGFTASDFFDDVPLGQCSKDAVMCQDIQNLTFADASIDICISQDVMEHVPDPWKGFHEIFRVLRPSGLHIFTIPYSPGAENSVARATLGDNGPHHLLPAEYHGDPIRQEGALVFTDFGRDLLHRLEEIGFSVTATEIHKTGVGGGYTTVFTAAKPAVVAVETAKMSSMDHFTGRSEAVSRRDAPDTALT